MSKLHYVGFNGYNQCPKIKNNFPEVISNWISFEENGVIVACNHRFVIVEREKQLLIFGLLSLAIEDTVHYIEKPNGANTFESCDKYIIASNGRVIWKYEFLSLEWSKCELKFCSEEEKSLWEEKEKSIIKFSFQHTLTYAILLLSDGSVWKLSEDDTLSLFFPNDLDKVIDVVSGLEHSLFLTESGCVLAFGIGSRGQLGHGYVNSTEQLVQIAALEGLKVTKIAAGGWHSCAITDTGDLYTWGWNNFGQLSVVESGEFCSLYTEPVCVQIGNDIDVNVVDVACGRRHTICMLETGEFCASGWNLYNQLGINSECDKVSQFTKCQIKINQIKKLLCGPWYTIIVEESEK